MASVSGVSSGNVSSLYGNRNVLTGLASGMDTESMIENSVSGIRLKISGLQQKQTKLDWKQEAYRSITDKMVQFARKYTSYTSSTNLLSASFFNKAVNVVANGANAGKVSATGKTNSSVQIDSVDQLATASRYVHTAGLYSPGNSATVIRGGGSVDLAGDMQLSTLGGFMSFQYGGKSVGITFDENEVYTTAEELKNAIADKLSQQTITMDSGRSYKASELIDVQLDDATGKIRFSDKKGGGNQVYLSGASDNIKDALGFTTGGDYKPDSFTVDPAKLSKTVKTAEYLSGKTMSFTLDGVTKKITLPEVVSGTSITEGDYVNKLNKSLEKAFGTGKITAGLDYSTMGSTHLTFEIQPGSSLAVSSGVNKALGLDSTASTYLNTGKTLGELSGVLDGLTTAPVPGSGNAAKQDDGTYLDADGRLVDEHGYLLDEAGNPVQGYELRINDTLIGTYTQDTALETVLVDINSNTEAGVNVNYSKTTNQFVFQSKETGAGQQISIDSGGLAERLFGAIDPTAAGAGSNYTAGVDAKLNVTINGTAMSLVRSNNTFDVDGMSVTVKDTFAAGTEAVTFTTKADTEKIMGAIKSMVEDYNAMAKEIRDAYSTLPAQKSDKSKYEPLTESDKEDMTETAIKNYEEKAKQGLLFGDSDLSSLYGKLLSAIAPSGSDGAALRAMGLSTDYSEGLTTLSLDETALREALENNPDSVTEAFTKVAGAGSSTDGLMSKLKAQLDTYASTSGTKGILINKAGSKYSPVSLLDNSLKDQMDEYDTQIEKWQDKLSDKVDYYTRQFSRLEQLIMQMNSQSSSIMSMMGGTSS